eukprot:gene2290-2434_t
MELEKPAQLSSDSSFSSSSSSSLRMDEDDDEDDVVGNANPSEEQQEDYFSDQTQLPLSVPLNPLHLSQTNKPKEIITSGLFTMILDDTNRIEKFHVDIHYFSEEEISHYE